MKSRKYQEASVIDYTDCTAEEVVDFVLDVIKPIDESRESAVSFLKGELGNTCIMRPGADIVYSAVIWRNRYENVFTVKYITDYLKDEADTNEQA